MWSFKSAALSCRKCYVLLAIALTLLLCGLVFFFLLPRDITIKEGSIVSYRVEFAHDNATIIHVTVMH